MPRRAVDRSIAPNAGIRRGDDPACAKRITEPLGTHFLGSGGPGCEPLLGRIPGDPQSAFAADRCVHQDANVPGDASSTSGIIPSRQSGRRLLNSELRTRRVRAAKKAMWNNISREDGHSVTRDDSQPPLHPRDAHASAGKSIPCDSAPCSQRAVSWIDFRFLCLDHLVSHCYERLEEFERAGNVQRTASADVKIQSSSDFLEDCPAKIASLLITHTGLENIERARLLDILLWANELDRRRRSSQFPV